MKLKKLVFSAFFLALGLVLPFLTGQIPEIGGMMLPMHLPVIICGFICGWKYALLVGFITPLFRNLLFAMPPLFTAITMAFELAAYGAITGLLYKRLAKSKFRVYGSLILAMIAGRLVWGIASFIVYRLTGTAFTFQVFMAGAVLNAIPGIITQLILIPILITSLERTRSIPWKS